jgi:hypothetical protein
MDSLASTIESETGIKTEIFTSMGLTQNEPIIKLEFGGGLGAFWEPSNMDWEDKSPLDPINYRKGQDVRIPVVATLEFDHTGEDFAGMMVLYSLLACRYFYENGKHNVKAGSSDFTKTNISTSQEVNFQFNIPDATFTIDELDAGIAFQGEENMETWSFSQSWRCTLRLRVADVLKNSEV